MTLKAVYKKNVITVRASTSVQEAARLMKDFHVGFLVVTERVSASGHRVIGVVTDRDIVRFVAAHNIESSTVIVDEIMTRTTVCINENEGVIEALRAMATNGYRRIPVLDANGFLSGVVSTDDLLKLLSEELRLLADIDHQPQRGVEHNNIAQLVRPKRRRASEAGL